MTIFGAGRMGMFRQRAAAGGVTTPIILNTVVALTNSTIDHTTDTQAHTVPAGTEALLLLVLYGKNGTGALAETTPSSNVDGNFTVVPGVFNGADAGTGSGSNPLFGLWILPTPTAGAHNITWGASANLVYSVAVLIDLDHIDTADIIGVVESLRFAGSANADSNTFSDSVASEKSNSLMIAWGAWQGDDSLPIAEDLGLTGLVESNSGGTSITNDAGISVATKVAPGTPGTVNYGMTASVSDDYAYGIVEIRGAGS